MNKFARLPLREQQAYFQETASRRDLRLWTVEKDFWVCWMLGILFGPSGLGSHLVFKGGTSLSKVYGVIHRFSEDIDLSVSPAWLGFTGPPPRSRSGRQKWFGKLQEACLVRVREIQARVETIARENLSVQDVEIPYFTFEEDPVTQSPLLLFSYPTLPTPGPRERRQRIKLEFGSLTDQQPTGAHKVTSWVAEEFLDQFSTPGCGVTALEAERTFWEKATILHAYYNYPDGKPLPARLARHIYDIHCLAGHPIGKRAIVDFELLSRVADFKSLFFNSSWAHFETARPGTLRLVPNESRLQEWRTDYGSTEEMFMGTPPSFDELIETLRRLEGQINGGATPPMPRPEQAKD